MPGQITELQINRDIKVVAAFNDLMVSLKFLISGKPGIGPIKRFRLQT
jgi:hypothetical protein